MGNTVYFDGERLNPGEPPNPHLFALRDDGSRGTLLWTRAAVNPIVASFAQDPRGGFWSYYFGYPVLLRRSTRRAR